MTRIIFNPVAEAHFLQHFEIVLRAHFQPLGFEKFVLRFQHFDSIFQLRAKRAQRSIRAELEDRIKVLESQNKLLEAQRLKMRTEYDLEMLQEMGFCNGIENYSRHLSGRVPGSKPYTIMDFFPKDRLVVIDESHATIPQIGGMYEGDRSRKTVLVNYGFRLPSALDNRPLNFDERPIIE